MSNRLRTAGAVPHCAGNVYSKMLNLIVLASPSQCCLQCYIGDQFRKTIWLRRFNFQGCALSSFSKVNNLC